jgi:hypothetical protein
MNDSYQIGEVMSLLNQQFDGVQFLHEAIHLNEGLIHAFFIENSSKDSLGNNWRKISNFIALHFQNNLENEFERWNLYLFFLNAPGISNDLKYQIENDTFSSRKIIIDCPMDKDSIINKHILNNNLSINRESESLVDNDFQPKKLVWDLLKGKTLKKVRNTSEVEKSFNQLVKAIKKEDYEI